MTRPQNVLVAHNYYKLSGGEDRVFSSETQLLREQGINVAEFTKSNESVDELNPLDAAVKTVYSKKSYNEFRDKINKTKPDIVHFHNTFLLISPAAYYACADTGIPVIQTLHNYRLLCPSANFYRDNHVCEDCLGKTFPWPGIIHSCYRDSAAQSAVTSTMLFAHRLINTWSQKVDKFIALTNFVKKKFIEGGLPAEKIIVKPNFMNVDPMEGEHEGEFALFVGRLSREKGIMTLLRAWKYLTGIPLQLVGSGPQLDEAMNMTTPDVHILGELDHKQVVKRVKQARFLVVSSECYEGFPMTIIEAFGCGTPVIAPKLGAMEEIIEHKFNGLHFIPGDARDLAKIVDWAWQNPIILKRMGLNARIEYERKYTAEKNFQILMDIYSSTIAS